MWVICGPIEEIGSRASAGNQSPLFYGMLWAGYWTLVFFGCSPEWSIRLPSVLLWLSTISLTGWLCCRTVLKEEPDNPRGSSLDSLGWSFPVLMFSLLAITLDRIQWFYASEARPYAAVQLVSFLGWWQLLRMWRRRTMPKRDIVGWTLVVGLMLQLHLLSVVAVLWQWIVLFALALRRSLSDVKHCFLAGVVCALFFALALVWTPELWLRRRQWESFAGDSTWQHAVGLFPIVAILCPIAVCLAVDSLLASRKQHQPVQQREGRNWPEIFFWCVATLGPWLTAWLITAAGIAPVMHRRYVIVSAIPLVCFSASLLRACNRSRICSCAWLLSLASLLVTQQTLEVWRAGDVVGWQRVEGWRQAAEFVQQNWQQGDQLWCASELIEGNRQELPLDDSTNRYLSYPLRGAYRVIERNGTGATSVSANALVNDQALWAKQLVDRRLLGHRQWIVMRSTAEKLQAHLARVQSDMSNAGFRMSLRQSPVPFGRVSVACLEYSLVDQ